MKDVSILISNRDSYWAIQLAIESIRKYTKYPSYKIIVCDDMSLNGVDLKYLRECRDKGWIELYESKKWLGHGGVLNQLINNICDTSLAVILDSDTQILDHGWLNDFVGIIESRDNIYCVADTLPKYFTPHCYRVPIYRIEFCMFNMEVYQNGMEVDWLNRKVDRRDEPYKTIFTPYYPPEEPGINWERWDENIVAIDPGGNPWVKFNYDNPKGYRVIPLPPGLKAKHHHYDHISFLISGIVPDSMLESSNSPKQSSEQEIRQRQKGRAKLAIIKAELDKLRGHNA